MAKWEENITLRSIAVAPPQTIDDVVAVLTDKNNYPSLVRSAGLRNSSTYCGVTDGGTLLSTGKTDRILKIEDSG